MEILRVKEDCDCQICLSNNFKMWREYAFRMINKLSYIQKLKWFKSSEGEEYLLNIAVIQKMMMILKVGSSNKDWERWLWKKFVYITEILKMRISMFSRVKKEARNFYSVKYVGESRGGDGSIERLRRFLMRWEKNRQR